ncbi:MAG: 3-oxoacyl-ACP synthase [Sulfurimonas sp.]|uniref:beta-ketoacyl synthase N-terminal-like domain-containing protein n=1 Tax=Sulfurimonas sp. TaxID=2022749 RepID=UPI0025D25AE9|nr:beta-ketoacyl synthase N-terminal-like domain-containing protein [Sulfurimonas sp.]MCK9492016.1 3-oxoacyl-ACP synthase [Sulfurimonas sp.]
MHSINILDYTLRSSQGNTLETLQSIKNIDINISYKEVSTLNDAVEIPYYLFSDKVEDDANEIKEAIKKLVETITIKLTPQQRAKTALIIGTSLIDKNIIDSIESSVYEYKKKPYASSKKSIDSFANEISKELELNPFTMTISTACTSSINAVLEARNLINSGVVEYAIVVGVEIFSQMMSDGFSSMKLLSTDIQRPFDVARDGLVLGEAIAAVLVGKDSSKWSLRGGYSNCNSLNITSVSSSGEEYAEVMDKAMSFAKVTAQDITMLKAHATSTLTNDMSEINAIKKVFASDVTFSALKPYVGHTLGACGVLELAMIMSCIDDGFIPQTLNHKDSIIKEYTPLQEHKACSCGIFMLNYFGFGGNNTSVIIQKESK